MKSGISQASKVFTESSAVDPGTVPGAAGGVYVMLDGKNVTPRSLVPFLAKNADFRVDSDEFSTIGEMSQVKPQSASHQTVILPIAVKPVISAKHAFRPEAVSLLLVETDTVEIMSLPSLCVSLDNTALHSRVSSINKAYDELCASKSGSEAFRSRHTQTLDATQKMKEVYVSGSEKENRSIEASNFHIYDAFANPALVKHMMIQSACDLEASTTIRSCLCRPGCLLPVGDDIVYAPPVASERIPRKRPAQRKDKSGTSASSVAGGRSSGGLSGGDTMTRSVADGFQQETEKVCRDVTPPKQSTTTEETSENMKLGEDEVLGGKLPENISASLGLVERIVGQNSFHAQHMLYRNYPTIEELAMMMRSEKVQEKEKIEDLFEFRSPSLTTGMKVTSLVWNMENNDLLAASYSSLTEDKGERKNDIPDESKRNGLVLFWSLKNPLYPDLILKTHSGVTCLAYSTIHPFLLAAGMIDGSLAIWDLRKISSLTSVVCASPHIISKEHSDAIFALKWVDKGADKVPRETLISVGADGHILHWTIKKGLEFTTIMSLKRATNKHLGTNCFSKTDQDATVFQQSVGFSVDFPRGNHSTYFVGSDDGIIHKCSTAYNEQDLEVYSGHSGPVYKVECNPFLPDVFITCSTDWSVKLWSSRILFAGQTATESPVQNFQSTDLFDAVNDINWSPHCSTSFAAVMDDGRVEVWDIARKALDPVIVHYPKNDRTTRRTCVKFSVNSPVLATGDDAGNIQIMRLFGLEVPLMSEIEQQDKLLRSIGKKQ